MSVRRGRILAVVALVVGSLVVGSLVGAGATLTVIDPAAPADTTDDTDRRTTIPEPSPEPNDVEGTLDTFESRAAFEDYVRRGRLLDGDDGTVAVRRGGRPTAAERGTGGDVRVASGGGDGGSSGGAVRAPSRIAATNVQVAGLDEPDIVKTDGRHFFYAPGGRGYRADPEPTGDPGPVPTVDPDRQSGVPGGTPIAERPKRTTHVIDVADPGAPEAVADIDTSGKLLLSGDTLVVIGNRNVTGYDVTDPGSPTERWTKPLNASLVTAREQNGTVYLVTRSGLGYESPCPVEPLGPANGIACSDIYRPGTQIPVDATYSAFGIDADTGEVEGSVSFVGTTDNTVVYMSPDALYVTYTKEANRAALLGDYVRTEFGMAPDSLDRRVAEIMTYDISAASKEREVRRAVQQWIASLPPAKREAARRTFREGFVTYLAGQQRSLTRTGIVRVGVDGGALSVGATGTVPGRPLDQFSMDQHRGTLRITTTIPAVGDAPSVNDLYTLAADSLDRRGSVTGMGETERVYSVRYVDDTAYVVTFRRVDPFHVIDLSDPADPEEVGRLKLPGFSSYLHPVDGDHVLGIGEENGRVKAVLFDVSDPANPTVDDDEILDGHWSAVSRTHHAFLLDRKHGVFFLPTGERGVVVDYTNESLSVETTIDAGRPPSRARYVGDSLYVFAGQRIAVVDETTWEWTATLELPDGGQ